MENQVTDINNKSQKRLEVLAKIEEHERKGLWHEDLEPDPPTIPLTPDKIDYLNHKLKNKILSKVFTFIAQKFINKLEKDKKLIIKEVIGMENFHALANQGAFITCNHFNPFDNFALHQVFLPSLHKEHRELYKVIKEGNYTNFPGFFGMLFRHCHTLPLSENFSTMKKFIESVKVLLARSEKILIYPEQAMWWNYKKPRPLSPGAFRFAAENKVPVLPVFITLSDSELLDDDGFPTQEYTVHISPAIYPDPNKKIKENTEELKNKNYEIWKSIYEKTYGIPLTYLTE